MGKNLFRATVPIRFAAACLTTTAVFLTGGMVSRADEATHAELPEVVSTTAPVRARNVVQASTPLKVSAQTVEAGEAPDEAELIDAALVEQGYFREDVPLTFEEQDYLQTACAEFGVDYELMLSLIYRETRFQNIVGDGGNSIGYCQIQPRWWGSLMEEIGAEDLTDPYDNFRTGCAIVAQLTEKYGNVRDALSAYNTGAPGHTEYAASVLAGMEVWTNA